MFLAMVKISPSRGKQQEVLDILLSVKGPMLAASGSIECSIYEERDEEYAIIFMEKWHMRSEMIDHIGSALYARVLKALELSDRPPEICFYEIAGTQGIELIENVRTSTAGIRR
ncbi:MAG TPA: antibiotic biosynthesis monooxygenase [Desulfuromonadaceae bacterium]